MVTLYLAYGIPVVIAILKVKWREIYTVCKTVLGSLDLSKKSITYSFKVREAEIMILPSL